MSLIEELGARLHAASADLPLAALAVAHDRLRAASALLMWVRQQSTHPLGVPELSGAIEHLEHAAHALQVTQDSVDRKSTRLNSSHSQISYAVFCLKKKRSRKHSAIPVAPP